MNDLNGIREYYQARVNDLVLFSQHGTPWEFLGGAMLIEWIANLTDPKRQSWTTSRIQRPHFVDLIAQHLPQYAQFEFQTDLVDIDNLSVKTNRYLPLQMYLSFRNPLVHRFSTVPQNRTPGYVPPNVISSYKQLDRPGCILITHREDTSLRGDGEHLSLLEGDRCLLRSPDFIEDIGTLINSCFDSAQTDAELNKRIFDNFNERRPLDTLGEIPTIRRGPSF
ncbi:MAG: hypothetical protein NW224_13180 [Leptolyngbyaceae cyanobacterium bins.302]|nr:hypothetical protein [Leptolyngbyaceae cyanobacterium bins.302]